jgi:hypothetical protein
MGYDLRPRNKSAGSFHMGAFSWGWMLENGVGLPVGYGPGFAPAQFIYRTRPDGKCIGYNDGARVTAAEAKEMAKVARWLADYQEDLYAQWMKEPEESRQRMQGNTSGLYKCPVRRDFVEKVRAFSEWAGQSGGFRVY